MTTIETIEIDGILGEVEVDWDLYKGNDNKRTKNAFVDFLYRLNVKGYKLLSEYANTKTKVLIDFNCGHEPNWIRPNAVKQGVGCPKCATENNSGENCNLWKGGVSPLAKHLREKINQWKKDSFKQTNYKCVITGVKGSVVVHHLTGFNTILFETMETLNLPIYQTISEYTPEELKLIENKCLELHYKYGLGVVLSEEVHKEFHSIYGYGDNTPEQFKEFKQMKLNHKEECA